jgi:hypothetical protein
MHSMTRRDWLKSASAPPTKNSRSLGHREHTWMNPIYTDLLMGGIGWAVGKLSAEIPSSLGRLMVTPK